MIITIPPAFEGDDLDCDLREESCNDDLGLYLFSSSVCLLCFLTGSLIS